MIKITIQIEGMQCGMCEAHINDVMRREFPVKKVSSSHAKGQTVIITEDELSLIHICLARLLRKTRKAR